jgi:protein-L-isoaspartate(D-aspartate) O-methyltransferase
MTDSKAQRLNMVESQVRPSDVTDRRIIRAMSNVARELFVPGPLASTAYMDVDVPVEAGQGASSGRYLLAPRVLAKLVQAAALEDTMTVLDVGCATGYSTAIIAAMARDVTGLECSAALVASAQKALGQLGLAKARVVQGPLEDGLAAQGGFDAIILNGTVAVTPAKLIEQLKDGGRLVGIFAEGYFGQACVWRRVGKQVDRQVLFDAGAHPLPGFAAKAEFVF